MITELSTPNMQNPVIRLIGVDVMKSVCLHCCAKEADNLVHFKIFP